MPEPDRQWEVGPLRRGMLRVAIVFGFALVLGPPVGALVFGSREATLTWAYLVFFVGWLALGGVIMSFTLRDTTRFVLRSDGRIEARRPIGTVRTHAGRVTRITLSIWGESRSDKPIAIVTPEGTVLLDRGFPDRVGIVAAIRSHNPDVEVDL